MLHISWHDSSYTWFNGHCLVISDFLTITCILPHIQYRWAYDFVMFYLAVFISPRTCDLCNLIIHIKTQGCFSATGAIIWCRWSNPATIDPIKPDQTWIIYLFCGLNMYLLNMAQKMLIVVFEFITHAMIRTCLHFPCCMTPLLQHRDSFRHTLKLKSHKFSLVHIYFISSLLPL